MKKKLELGSQIDINASFDGGAVDTSVEYSVPADQQDVVTVDASTGVVQAVSVGTATVEVKDTSGNLLRAIVFQVLSAEDFAMQDDLDTGVAEFTAEFAEVPVAPMSTPFSLTVSQQSASFVVGWQTTINLSNRIFQVGVRTAGSSASATSTTGRIAYENTTSLSGAGPFSQTVFMPSGTQSGLYEVYVQDLSTNEIITMQHDYAQPFETYGLNITQTANSRDLTVSWSGSYSVTARPFAVEYSTLSGARIEGINFSGYGTQYSVVFAMPSSIESGTYKVTVDDRSNSWLMPAAKIALTFSYTKP